jgi:hypothetical protein
MFKYQLLINSNRIMNTNEGDFFIDYHYFDFRYQLNSILFTIKVYDRALSFGKFYYFSCILFKTIESFEIELDKMLIDFDKSLFDKKISEDNNGVVRISYKRKNLSFVNKIIERFKK